MINKAFSSIYFYLSIAIALFPNEIIRAQEEVSDAVSTQFSRTGQFYFAWGYNRAQFSNSDIRMIGAGYDFTLHDVQASDRPEGFNFKNYFSIERLAVPQFNIRWGYYINDNWSVSFGYDHMKYVVKQWQTVTMSGTIDSSASAYYAGNYTNDSITIRRSFFDYEHTNGLNYMSFESDFIYPVLKNTKNNFRLNIEGGAGFALIIPRSDVFLFGEHGANRFHLAGFGVHLNGGLRIDLGKHFFFRANVKAGFINLPDVLTFKSPGFKAKQHFYFLEEYGLLGYAFRLQKRKR